MRRPTALAAALCALLLGGCAAAPAARLDAHESVAPLRADPVSRPAIDAEVFRIRVLARELRLLQGASLALEAPRNAAEPCVQGAGADTGAASAPVVVQDDSKTVHMKKSDRREDEQAPKTDGAIADSAGLDADPTPPAPEALLADASVQQAPRSCELADAICGSAYTICDIAEAEADPELTATCAWAVAECDQARALCDSER